MAIILFIVWRVQTEVLMYFAVWRNVDIREVFLKCDRLCAVYLLCKVECITYPKCGLRCALCVMWCVRYLLWWSQIDGVLVAICWGMSARVSCIDWVAWRDESVWLHSLSLNITWVEGETISLHTLHTSLTPQYHLHLNAHLVHCLDLPLLVEFCMLTCIM